VRRRPICSGTLIHDVAYLRDGTGSTILALAGGGICRRRPVPRRHCLALSYIVLEALIMRVLFDFSNCPHSDLRVRSYSIPCRELIAAHVRSVAANGCECGGASVSTILHLPIARPRRLEHAVSQRGHRRATRRRNVEVHRPFRLHLAGAVGNDLVHATAGRSRPGFVSALACMPAMTHMCVISNIVTLGHRQVSRSELCRRSRRGTRSGMRAIKKRSEALVCGVSAIKRPKCSSTDYSAVSGSSRSARTGHPGRQRRRAGKPSDCLDWPQMERSRQTTKPRPPSKRPIRSARSPASTSPLPKRSSGPVRIPRLNATCLSRGSP
jgi:hypothetical protein